MGYLVEVPLGAVRRVSSKTRFSHSHWLQCVLEIRFEDAQMRDTFGQNRPREYSFMMVDVGMLRSSRFNPLPWARRSESDSAISWAPSDDN